MNNRRIVFYTYGDSRKYDISKKHLIYLAKKSDIFDNLYSFSRKDVPKYDEIPYKHILRQERGGGYWIWKYLLLEKLLTNTKKNDLIVYCDSGSSFNYYAKNRLLEYFDLLDSSEFGNFRIESKKIHIEKYWTTKEIFKYFNVMDNKEITDSPQLLGGYLIFKNCEQTKYLLNIFFQLIRTDWKLITDEYNNNQIKQFIENRHDQSILSVISKKYGSVVIENETYFENESKEQLNYPFLSVRNYGHGKKDRIKYLINYKEIKTKPVFF